MKIKEKIDTINLNFFDQMDHSVVKNNSKYSMIDLFPNTKYFFDYFNIKKEKFYLNRNSIASKVNFNTENGIYFSFKSIPPQKLEKINHERKIISLQLKGQYFLENSWEDFLNFYNRANFLFSVSKIEIAFDVNEKLVRDSMELFLFHRNKITNFEGEHNIYMNIDLNSEKGISYFNATKGLKIYDKKLELADSKKENIFYLKNPELVGEEITRIEISYMTKKRIETLFAITSLLKNNVSETNLINKIKDKFFTEFEVRKRGKIKNILKIIKEA